jgi:NADPH:quinone reductase-like Zn-dependent oxidoreductase
MHIMHADPVNFVWKAAGLLDASNATKHGDTAMKAAWTKSYGPPEVLEIRDIPRPLITEAEVLVEVRAASVTTADWRLRASAFPAFAWLPGRLMFGIFAPRNKVPGSDFAGRVVAAGAAVTGIAVGDAVFGSAGQGAHAQFVKIAEHAAIVPMPKGMAFADAAAVPFGALAALVFLRDFGAIAPGMKVLVLGAAGGVGVHAVQLAKHFGAHVTAVCSAANRDLAASLGADRVIDHGVEDFTQSGESWDLIFDPVGATSFRACKPALAPRGVYLPLEFGLREIAQALITRRSGGKRVVIGVSGDARDDLIFVKGLLDGGALRPVIDGRYPLAQIADAHRRVESRRKTGAVIALPFAA